MIFNVTGPYIDTGPEYPDGDAIKYPTTVDPSARKVYQESDANLIALQINTITQPDSDTYTLHEMSGALSDINDDVRDISNAINSIIGEVDPIALKDMANVILNVMPHGGLKAKFFDLTISECTITT